MLDETEHSQPNHKSEAQDASSPPFLPSAPPGDLPAASKGGPGTGPSASPSSAAENQMPPTRPRPLAVWALLAASLILYLVSCPSGSFKPSDKTLIQFGAKVNHLIEAGQVWRLLSCAFLHGFPAHLLLNMLALLSLGLGLEAALGARRLLCLFVAASVVSSFASFVYNPSMSVGMSGALFGLFGTELVFILKILVFRRRLGQPCPPGAIHSLFTGFALLSVNLVLGLLLPGVDNMAHLGGLLAGVALGLAIPVKRMTAPRPAWRESLLNLSALTSVSLLAYTALCVTRFAASSSPAQLQQHLQIVQKNLAGHGRRNPGSPPGPGVIRRWLPGISAREHFQKALACHEQKDLDQAAALYLKSIELDPKLMEAYFNLGLVYLERHEYDRATEMFLRVIELRPESAEAHLNLGIIYSLKGALELAHEAFEKAVELAPTSARAHRELGRSFERVNLRDQARKHYLEACRLDPTDDMAEYYLGLLQIREGDEDGARRTRQRLLHLNVDLAEELQSRIERRFGALEE